MVANYRVCRICFNCFIWSIVMSWGIDNGLRYSSFEDWKKISKDLGYPDIKTAIISEYKRLGGMKETAAIFNCSTQTIFRKLKGYRLLLLVEE